MRSFFVTIVKRKYALLSLCIAFLAGFALLHPGLPPTHDGEYHVIRFYEFDKVLRAGNVYPRWAPDFNLGYGVPLFTFVYPLPNYLASLFHMFGFSFIDSLKGEMFLATILGGVFCYLFVKEFFGEQAGCIASAFYSFSPYHFVDIYIRGSVGEVWALALFPFWLWSYTKFVRSQKISYFLYATVSMSFIIFSHNILALMFFIFAFFYMSFFIFQSKRKLTILLSSFYIIFLSLGLSAIFWLPALFQTRYVEGLQIYTIQKNFPDLFQLLFPSWGSGFFDNNLTNQMSVQIGVANLFGVCMACVVYIKHAKRSYQNKALILFFLYACAVTFFLLTPFSSGIWQHVPLLHYFQFPWRLLSLMILICSFLAGSFFYKNRSVLWAILFLGILFVSTYDYAHPAFYHLRNDMYYTTRSNFMDGTNSPGNEFRTIWTPVFSEKAKQDAFITNGEGRISVIKKDTTKEVFFAETTSPAEITFSKGYYPSWIVTVNNRVLSPQNANGLLHVFVPKGILHITISVGSTSIENLSLLVSCFSLLLLTGITISHLSFVRKPRKTL